MGLNRYGSVCFLRAWDDHDPALSEMVARGPVLLAVVADQAAFRHPHAGIDDGVADTAMAADLNVIQQDRVVHLTVAVHANAGRQDAADDPAS